MPALTKLCMQMPRMRMAKCKNVKLIVECIGSAMDVSRVDYGGNCKAVRIEMKCEDLIGD